MWRLKYNQCQEFFARCQSALTKKYLECSFTFESLLYIYIFSYSTPSILKKQHMSVLSSQQLQKIKYAFDTNSVDGKNISSKYVKRFFSDIGLSSQLFVNQLNYYFPQLRKSGSSLSYEDCISFIDYMLTIKQKQKDQKIESFQIFDKNGNGQINTSDLLLILKKRLPKKQYELYNQMIPTTFGPVINYLEVFNGKPQNA